MTNPASIGVFFVALAVLLVTTAIAPPDVNSPPIAKGPQLQIARIFCIVAIVLAIVGNFIPR